MPRCLALAALLCALFLGGARGGSLPAVAAAQETTTVEAPTADEALDFAAAALAADDLADARLGEGCGLLRGQAFAGGEVLAFAAGVSPEYAAEVARVLERSNYRRGDFLDLATAREAGPTHAAVLVRTIFDDYADEAGAGIGFAFFGAPKRPVVEGTEVEELAGSQTFGDAADVPIQEVVGPMQEERLTLLTGEGAKGSPYVLVQAEPVPEEEGTPTP